ncbi:MAG: multiheme c-type cytochrome [Thermoguttaceae bacterium]|nr:multiheme c-type cytochrome [Thermoguttaceae bacterium]
MRVSNFSPLAIVSLLMVITVFSCWNLFPHQRIFADTSPVLRHVETNGSQPETWSAAETVSTPHAAPPSLSTPTDTSNPQNNVSAAMASMLVVPTDVTPRMVEQSAPVIKLSNSDTKHTLTETPSANQTNSTGSIPAPVASNATSMPSPSSVSTPPAASSATSSVATVDDALDDDEENVDPEARLAWFEAKRQKAAEEAEKAIQLRKYGTNGYDPIQENGEYFEGWTRPDLTLVFTGQMNDYLEPCGCAGLVRMNGGLSRRFTFFDSLRKQGWNPIGFDVGGQIKSFGRQEELKFQLATESLRRMGYGAITLGQGDLRLSSQELVSYVAPTDAGPSLFVSANVAPFGFDAGFTALYRKLRVNGITVGVTGVLGDSFRTNLSDRDLATRPAEEGLRLVLDKLRDCQLIIVLSHASPEETATLAKAFPQINVIVTAGGPATPPQDAPQKIGQTTLVEVGEKGAAAAVLGFDADKLTEPRYQRVMLDSRYTASPEIMALMRDYQSTLEELGFAELQRRPIPYPNTDQLGGFVGSQRCQACHEEIYEHWRGTKHASAMETLENATTPRHCDPECICCHVVGWEPQKSFPWDGGYESIEKTPQLAGVGCESCHGPGGSHIQAEAGTDIALQKQLRESLHLTPMEAEQQNCIGCHDGDNSPDFDFKLYHPVIDHPVTK